MNCLYCGKELKEEDRASGWHKNCIRRFFGTKKMPEIEINNETVGMLAKKNVSSGNTVTGVQKKLSLHLEKEGTARLTIRDYPMGYILKPQAEEFEKLPEAEDAAMRMAAAVGVRTAEHGLLKLKDGSMAYITKRMDRDGGKMYAMEDFCQLSGRLTSDKYRGSYERCGEIIRKYSSMPGMDISEFFIRVAVSFVTGNSDMHLKNFSLIEDSPGSRIYRLSPAYDLLPVNMVMPEDKEETALALNGKKRNIRKKDLVLLAENLGINEKAAEKMLGKVVSGKNEMLTLCEKSYISDEQKEKLSLIIYERCGRLS